MRTSTYTNPTGDNGLTDSGERRTFDTGSVRDLAEGKGRFDLLPYRALCCAARQMERGAAKYGDRNWELGQPLGEYLNSGMRHLWKYWLGYTDEPHLDAFVWNALAFAETAERIRLGILPQALDNRPTIGRATDEEQGKVTEPAPFLRRLLAKLDKFTT